MTKTETTKLLALIQAFDRRTVGEADVEAWHLVVGDLDAADCAEAVRQHFTRRAEWLMPVDVRQGVGRIRAQRLALAGDPPPDADPDDPIAYREALRQSRYALAGGGQSQRAVAALTVGKTTPRADYGTAAKRAREIEAAAKRERVQAALDTDPELRARVEVERQRMAEARAEIEASPAAALHPTEGAR